MGFRALASMARSATAKCSAAAEELLYLGFQGGKKVNSAYIAAEHQVAHQTAKAVCNTYHHGYLTPRIGWIERSIAKQSASRAYQQKLQQLRGLIARHEQRFTTPTARIATARREWIAAGNSPRLFHAQRASGLTRDGFSRMQTNTDRLQRVRDQFLRNHGYTDGFIQRLDRLKAAKDTSGLYRRVYDKAINWIPFGRTVGKEALENLLPEGVQQVLRSVRFGL